MRTFIITAGICIAVASLFGLVKTSTAEASTVTNPDGHVACACNATKCCCGVAMGYVPNMICQ
jgi:hypothetical protein